MESIVSGSDDPNNQLAFVQQLVSQLSVGGGNPITINVVAGDINNQNVQGDYNNNDHSKNILEKLNEVSTDVKALQTGQTAILHLMRLNYEVHDGFESNHSILLMIQIPI